MDELDMRIEALEEAAWSLKEAVESLQGMGYDADILSILKEVKAELSDLQAERAELDRQEEQAMTREYWQAVV